MPYDLLCTYQRQLFVGDELCGWRMKGLCDSAVGSISRRRGGVCLLHTAQAATQYRTNAEEPFWRSEGQSNTLSECRKFLSSKCLKYTLPEVERVGANNSSSISLLETETRTDNGSVGQI